MYLTFQSTLNPTPDGQFRMRRQAAFVGSGMTNHRVKLPTNRARTPMFRET